MDTVQDEKKLNCEICYDQERDQLLTGVNQGTEYANNGEVSGEEQENEVFHTETIAHGLQGKGKHQVYP